MLTASRLAKKFEERTVIDSISFSYLENGIVGLAGHNGSGKSTLLRILGGLVRPSSGNILINGRHSHEQKGVVAYAPPQLTFALDFTPLTYLSYISKTRGKFSDIKIIEEMLHTLKVQNLASRMNELSYGNLQKVNLAQALAERHSKVLLLDEPMNGLDTSAQSVTKELIRDRGKKQLVFFVSHNLDELNELCSDMILLREGNIVYKGIEIVKAIKRTKIVFTVSSIDALELNFANSENEPGLHQLIVTEEDRGAAIKDLFDNGAQIVEIASFNITLDEIYKQLGF